MTSKRLLVALAAGALALCPAARSSAQQWAFQFEPYALASTIEGDAGVGRATGVEVNVGLSEILEVLELAFMGHFEAHHDNGWGVMLDYGFMDLGADISGPRGGVLNAEVHQGVFEAMLVRRVDSGDGHLDYLAGVRWWDNDIDVTVDAAVQVVDAASDEVLWRGWASETIKKPSQLEKKAEKVMSRILKQFPPR